MTKKDDGPKVGTDYAFAQLARVLRGAGERTAERARKWRGVIDGILNGTLQIGSRRPVPDLPLWVTLDVLYGGFACGDMSAGGELRPHETEKLAELAPQKLEPRARLNAHFLSDEGLGELEALLTSGRYRTHVPEESALLTVAWLLRKGHRQKAEAVVDEIAPFFDRLRFYPIPHQKPMAQGTEVYVQPVSESVASLRRVRRKRSIDQMDEAIRIWTPLYDRAVSLFLETVEGDMPTFAVAASGHYEREADGNPVVVGGLPCRTFSKDWDQRARAFLEEYRVAREHHTLCGKPERRRESFAQLRGFMSKLVGDSPLSAGEQKKLRSILAAHVTKHGAPGSQRLQAKREVQAANIARPRHQQVAQVLCERLQALDQDEGDVDIESKLAPLTSDEAFAIGAEPGDAIPQALVRKAKRCMAAPVEELIDRGVIGSSEAMAAVLPALTAQVRASGIEDAELQRVYLATYKAFRRRRSVLLLNLESQVRFHELPWVSSIADWVGSDEASRTAAHETLEKVVRLSIEKFPYTILPNKLVRELRALAVGAGLELPLVDEVAADIFTGSFSRSFLHAAQRAGQLLRGTLYERYYAIPYHEVLQLDDLEQKRGHVAASSPGFAKICQRLAPKQDRWSVASNGVVIEQSQILTTHNLAVLFEALGLTDSMRGDLPTLARDCFRWICNRQERPLRFWKAHLQMIKNTAYAWRQMVFYLSLAEEQEALSFVEWASDHLASQGPELSQRLGPALEGLRLVAEGESLDSGIHPSGARRFLGWSLGRHWLMPSTETSHLVS